MSWNKTSAQKTMNILTANSAARSRPMASRCATLIGLCFCSLVNGANPPQFIDLGTLGGSINFPAAINANGQVVGTSETADGQIHPFIWDAVDGIRDLAVGVWGNAAAINNLGQVAGTRAVGEIVALKRGSHSPDFWPRSVARMPPVEVPLIPSGRSKWQARRARETAYSYGVSRSTTFSRSGTVM